MPLRGLFAVQDPPGQAAHWRRAHPGKYLLMLKNTSDPAFAHSALARIVERNINALLARRGQEERAKSTEEKVADAVTRFAGSMRFVYLHILLYGAWILMNALPFVPKGFKFDPTFVILAMFASVESIFLSTFILISQNRMTALQGKRADLDLQISLLAEHEVTRLVTLVGAMAAKMGIEEAHDPELPELERDVAPEKVLDAMERSEKLYSDAGK